MTGADIIADANILNRLDPVHRVHGCPGDKAERLDHLQRDTPLRILNAKGVIAGGGVSA